MWTVQVFLAALFAGSGIAKFRMSKQQLIATGQTGAAAFPMPVVRFTAIMELLAAVGLIVPWLTNIAPVLTPLAAVGLATVMIGAACSHARLRHASDTGVRETRNLVVNIVIFALCLFVAISRFGQLP
jgi:uncharacterized membrane protein YphA (DoxX/SURF4 family)